MKKLSVLLFTVIFLSLSCRPVYEFATYAVGPGSNLAGKKISELDFKEQYDVQILKVQNDSTLITDPDSTYLIQAGDTLITYGPKGKIASLSKIYK